MEYVYAIHARRETYYCLAQGPHAGEIWRVGACSSVPSGQWKPTALVEPHGFGYRRRFNFDQWALRLPLERDMHIKRGDFWTYKNGRERFTLRDLDHGTHREWGERVRKVSLVPLYSIVGDFDWRAMHPTLQAQAPDQERHARAMLDWLESAGCDLAQARREVRRAESVYAQHGIRT